MLVSESLYTAEEFLELLKGMENADRRLELDEGVIVELPPSSQINSVLAIRFARFLSQYVDDHDLGYVTGADAGFRLAPNVVRQPDVAFISKARHPELSGVVFPVAPDLAIEIVSPSEDIVKKVNQYIHAGTQLVWTVYADERTVYVWQKADEGGLNVKLYGIDNTLDGSTALPGFTVLLRDIFGHQG